MLHFVYTNTGYYCESALWLNDLLILEIVITHIQYTDCTQIPCDSTKYALVSANDHLYIINTRGKTMGAVPVYVQVY